LSFVMRYLVTRFLSLACARRGDLVVLPLRQTGILSAYLYLFKKRVIVFYIRYIINYNIISAINIFLPAMPFPALYCLVLLLLLLLPLFLLVLVLLVLLTYILLTYILLIYILLTYILLYYIVIPRKLPVLLLSLLPYLLRLIPSCFPILPCILPLLVLLVIAPYTCEGE